ncbi:hypothetical protein ZIOFF_071170 [Zingiber officinale]|uniref:Signal recognition particle SRP54 helical bundle domain-containing protein n=1 Tax=Zingiber officinale TaxID=94328 RepID=A0A8J5ETF7_ZINOF|nr:hypothetical protein ZIOFF_071170 [Zingiber officinale]
MSWNRPQEKGAQVLDELEEALLVSDFGPKISFKIVDSLREDILAGKLKSGSEIKEALKTSVLQLLTSKGSKTELQLGFRKPAMIMIVGVNGGGKTMSLGNHFDLVCSLAHFPPLSWIQHDASVVSLQQNQVVGSILEAPPGYLFRQQVSPVAYHHLGIELLGLQEKEVEDS